MTSCYNSFIPRFSELYRETISRLGFDGLTDCIVCSSIYGPLKIIFNVIKGKLGDTKWITKGQKGKHKKDYIENSRLSYTNLTEQWDELKYSKMFFFNYD